MSLERFDPMMEDIKKTLQEILDCQQSLMQRLDVVENTIKGWLNFSTIF